MELFGTHKVSFESVRALAVQCHALDIAAYHLLSDSTHEDKSGKTKATYEDIFTFQLLALAISLRTKLNQGENHKATVDYVSHCGFLFKYKNNTEESLGFSFKDVCDKIIHASTVSRHLEHGVQKPTTTLRGRAQDNKSEWELSISVSLFAEVVLNWVQDVEEI
jgi:hypothetical protein